MISSGTYMAEAKAQGYEHGCAPGSCILTFSRSCYQTWSTGGFGQVGRGKGVGRWHLTTAFFRCSVQGTIESPPRCFPSDLSKHLGSRQGVE